MSTVYFRYGGSTLDFSTGQIAPVFPKQAGLTLHTIPTESIYYTNTNRYHGTTEISMQTQNVIQSQRNTVYTFWNTILGDGFNDFTFIDDRGRFLFECSWNDWNETWTKRNGGLHSIGYGLESSIPFTLPMYAFYSLTANDVNTVSGTFNNHNVSDTYDLTLSSATLVKNATDSNVLRLNGYALKLIGTGGTDTGASGTVKYVSSTQDRSISGFCQVRAPLSPSGAIVLMKISSGTSYIELRLTNGGAKNVPAFLVYTNGSTVNVSNVTKHFINNDTWTDIGWSFDATNGALYLYSFDSADSSFSNYLAGETDIEERYTSLMSPSPEPIDRDYDTVTLLQETTAGSITDTEIVYLQNVMIIDGVLSSMEFNTLRRLCYLWNKKTTDYPK